MKDDREMACCKLPLVVYLDRNEFVHQAKYELVHKKLELQKSNISYNKLLLL
jgi:hypothetical protein